MADLGNNAYRHGKTPAGHVRYRCPVCTHVFQLTYTYEARKPGVKDKIFLAQMILIGSLDPA